jgi:hypothetical protein
MSGQDNTILEVEGPDKTHRIKKRDQSLIVVWNKTVKEVITVIKL